MRVAPAMKPDQFEKHSEEMFLSEKCLNIGWAKSDGLSWWCTFHSSFTDVNAFWGCIAFYLSSRSVDVIYVSKRKVNMYCLGNAGFAVRMNNKKVEAINNNSWLGCAWAKTSWIHFKVFRWLILRLVNLFEKSSCWAKHVEANLSLSARLLPR